MMLRLTYTHEVFGTKGDGGGHWCNCLEEQAAAMCAPGKLQSRELESWGWSNERNHVVWLPAGEEPGVPL